MPAFLTPAHERLRQTVRAFAQAEVAPCVDNMEESTDVERELSTLIARQGWVGATIDASYNGMGAGHLAKTLIIQELSRVSAAMGAMVQASQLGTAMIIHFGSDEQKQTWLPAIASGQCLPTIAVTEEGSGSDVRSIGASARRVGNNYILTGKKVFVGNAHVGNLHGVVARTRPGSRGLSAFLVEADRPGLSVIPYKPALGLRGFSFGEIVMDEVCIPAANLLGLEGDGGAVAHSSSILYGRPNLTAVALGIHQAVVEETTSFAAARIRYGKPLSEIGVVKDKLGQMRAAFKTAQTTAYHAVWLLDQGDEPCDYDLMTAKLLNTESVIDSARIAMEIHGGVALLHRQPIQRYLRDAYCLPPAAATSDIQRFRLAQDALRHSHGEWSTRKHFTNAQISVRDQLKATRPQFASDGPN